MLLTPDVYVPSPFFGPNLLPWDFLRGPMCTPERGCWIQDFPKTYKTSLLLNGVQGGLWGMKKLHTYWKTNEQGTKHVKEKISAPQSLFVENKLLTIWVYMRALAATPMRKGAPFFGYCCLFVTVLLASVYGYGLYWKFTVSWRVCPSTSMTVSSSSFFVS